MKFEEAFFRLFMFWYACGIVLLSFNLIPPWLEWANGVFLVFAGLLAVIYFIKRFNLKYGAVISLVIFFFSFLVEDLGSAYNVLFGQYHYTDKFAPNLFDVPLAIGFAWLMVMGTSHALAYKIIPKGGFLYSLIGALIAVVIDLIIDPVAYKVKKYWIWEEDGLYYDIPFSNFIGWFLCALTFHLFISLLMKNPKNMIVNPLWEKRMILLFILMITMFVWLGLLNKLWFSSSLTTLLAGFIVVLAFKKKAT